MRYSGLQREVLSLYRNCLRESRKKDAVSLSELCLQPPGTDENIDSKAAFRVFCKVSRGNFFFSDSRQQAWAVRLILSSSKG